jgi:4-hydroxybenzoate polyprenyltransferase
MKLLNNFRKLLRIEQWYKNLIIFLPLLFASTTYTTTQYIVGFFGFCFVSSITYIINDWVDREKDALHPTKKFRPLTSGAISPKTATIVTAILALFVILSALYLGPFFGAVVGTYFVVTNAYSFGLKNIPLVDILIIAGNFVMRMMAGLEIFPTLDLLPYFGLLFGTIAIFLTHKRRSDIKLLGDKAAKHKPVLKFYNKRNSYIFRQIGYVIILLAFYKLHTLNVLTEFQIAAALLLLLTTSVLFSRDPHLTIKPHYLLKNPLWIAALILNIIIVFL